MYLGYGPTNTGAYSLSGSGLLSAGLEEVGSQGAGVFMQTGGTNLIGNENLYLGYQGANGTYGLAAGLLSASNEYVGSSANNYAGTGTFTQSGGTNSIAKRFILAYQSGSCGKYNLNGGLLVLRSLSQGSGTAAFNFNGGTLLAGGSFPPVCP